MTKISTVRHYRRAKDGTLKLVGIEHVEVDETHVTHIDGLTARDAADAQRRACEQEAFEALADSACGE